MTAFIIFCKEQRPLLRDAEPTLSFGETGSRLGQMWKTMNEAQKAKYVALSQADVARADAERKALAEQNAVVVDSKTTEDAQPKKRGRKPKAAASSE
jgi:hypothetical protein